MKDWSKMAEAFSIFAKYSNPETYDHVGSEHDELFAGPCPDVVSEPDKKRLEELGWDPKPDCDCWRLFT